MHLGLSIESRGIGATVVTKSVVLFGKKLSYRRQRVPTLLTSGSSLVEMASR